MVARGRGLPSSRWLTTNKNFCKPVTDKGVDGCVEILGVPKEKRMLVSSKMRNQHRHHSVAKRRKPVMLDDVVVVVVVVVDG